MTNKSILFILIAVLMACNNRVNIISDKGPVTNPVIDSILQRTCKEILVCAHRSFHKTAPENSLQSVKDAIEAGIDIIEIDVRTTKDDSLVLMHDKTIDRTTTGMGKIKDLTYTELQQFNLRVGDFITVHKVPTLFEILSILNGTKVIVNIDQKAVNVEALHGILKKLGMEHRCISYTGTWEKTKENLLLDSLFAVMPLADTEDKFTLLCDSVPSPLIHLLNETFTLGNMALLHEKQKCVFVNTLWEEDDTFVLGSTSGMDSVISLHPGIIQTDYPDTLINYLRQKGLHR